MQQATDPDDIAELFRTQDSIGSDSSLFLRVIRQLGCHGKPMGPVFLLTTNVNSERRYPLGMMTFTEKNRIVFWPVLPKNTPMNCTLSRVDATDHITLQLPSEKSHVTGYKASGKANHFSSGWQCVPLSGSKLRFWFTYLVRTSVLIQQDLLAQRAYPAPGSDKARREGEFERFAQNLQTINVPLPRCPADDEYVCVGLYLAPEPICAQAELPGELFPNYMGEMVDDWPVQAEYPVLVSQYGFPGQHVVVATACPPGRLKDPVCFGFPSRLQTKKNQELMAHAPD